MTGIAKRQEVIIDHNGHMIMLTIQGVGTLSLSPDTAHHIARALVKASNDVETGKRWPHASRINGS